MNSLLICISKAKVKLINMTLPYQFRKVKIVAGHPALILIIGGYTFVQLGSKSERRSCRLLERSSKTSERWCFSIYCLLFVIGASSSSMAYTKYESFPRILYHPQDVNERMNNSKNDEKSNHHHAFFTDDLLDIWFPLPHFSYLSARFSVKKYKLFEQ